MGRVLFLYGQSPYPTGAPEISELTRSSRTCVAATQGALPGALIKLTCALITPRLSPISSSLESCLLHPCLRRSKPPPPLPMQIERQFYLQARNTLYPSGVAVPDKVELNLTVDSTEDQQGKVVRPTSPNPSCRQHSQLSSTHSSAAAVIPQNTSFAPQRTRQILA